MKNNTEREAHYRDEKNWHTLAEMPKFMRIQKLENYPLVRFQIYIKNNYTGDRYHTQNVYELDETSMALSFKNIYDLTINQAIGIMREKDKAK